MRVAEIDMRYRQDTTLVKREMLIMGASIRHPVASHEKLYICHGIPAHFSYYGKRLYCDEETKRAAKVKLPRSNNQVATLQYP